MGSSFSCDFNVIRNHYLNIVKFVNERKEFLMTDTSELRNTVRNYLNLDMSKYNNSKINEIAWVWSVHKLHPVDYAFYLKKNSIDDPACTESTKGTVKSNASNNFYLKMKTKLIFIFIIFFFFFKKRAIFKQNRIGRLVSCRLYSST